MKAQRLTALERRASKLPPPVKPPFNPLDDLRELMPTASDDEIYAALALVRVFEANNFFEGLPSVITDAPIGSCAGLLELVKAWPTGFIKAMANTEALFQISGDEATPELIKNNFDIALMVSDEE